MPQANLHQPSQPLPAAAGVVEMPQQGSAAPHRGASPRLEAETSRTKEEAKEEAPEETDRAEAQEEHRRSFQDLEDSLLRVQADQREAPRLLCQTKGRRTSTSPPGSLAAG